MQSKIGLGNRIKCQLLLPSDEATQWKCGCATKHSRSCGEAHVSAGIGRINAPHDRRATGVKERRAC